MKRFYKLDIRYVYNSLSVCLYLFVDKWAAIPSFLLTYYSLCFLCYYPTLFLLLCTPSPFSELIWTELYGVPFIVDFSIPNYKRFKFEAVYIYCRFNISWSCALYLYAKKVFFPRSKLMHEQTRIQSYELIFRHKIGFKQTDWLLNTIQPIRRLKDDALSLS